MKGFYKKITLIIMFFLLLNGSVVAQVFYANISYYEQSHTRTYFSNAMAVRGRAMIDFEDGYIRINTDYGNKNISFDPESCISVDESYSQSSYTFLKGYNKTVTISFGNYNYSVSIKYVEGENVYLWSGLLVSE